MEPIPAHSTETLAAAQVSKYLTAPFKLKDFPKATGTQTPTSVLALPTSASSGTLTPKQTKTKVSLDELHCRLGHISEEQLRKIVSATTDLAIDGNNKLSKCTVCIQAKQTCHPIGHGPVEQAMKPIQLIHSDLFGPIKTCSHSGKTGSATFIDDYTHWAAVYLIKHKSKLPDKFRKFLASIPAHLTVQQLQSDQGGEYKGTTFQTLLHNNKIKHTLSPPYTPKENGVAKHFNQTIFNMVQTLLLDAQLPRVFWAEAVHHAVYLYNCISHRALSGKSPYELLYSKPPCLAHLRPFGTHCFVLKPPHQRDKLGTRS